MNAAGIPVHNIYLHSIPIRAHRHFVLLTLRAALHPCGWRVTQSNRQRGRKGLLAVGTTDHGRIGVALFIPLNRAMVTARSAGDGNVPAAAGCCEWPRSTRGQGSWTPVKR